MRDQVKWGNTTIPFNYEYRQRKSLAISVHPDLTVTVAAPEGASIEAIKQKIRKRGAWIRKAWREFELYLPKQPERRYISGETHRYLGRQYRLKIIKREDETVKCLRGCLEVRTKAPQGSEKVKKLVRAWFRDKAHAIFRERLEACHNAATWKGVPMPLLRIQKMTSRWGSCSQAGRIMLNIELIKAPKDCIDYVITHELCHLKERHHGRRFWKLLGNIMPDYRERRTRLNRYADVQVY